jgi:hypothetical protein
MASRALAQAVYTAPNSTIIFYIWLLAASGAAIFPAENMNGWLNGRIFATTPRGSRTEKLIAPGPMGTECPFISVMSPAKKSSCDAAFGDTAEFENRAHSRLAWTVTLTTEAQRTQRKAHKAKFQSYV